VTQPKAAFSDAGANLGYIRVSTLDQSKKFSPDTQRDAISWLAQGNSHILSEVYEDHETATSVNRKDFQRLYARVMAGGVANVYFPYVDRFARNTEDALRVAREFKTKGARLHFGDMPGLDITTPEGQLLFTNYASFATFEHARSRLRSITNRAKKMDRGRPDSWNLPIGFRVVDDCPLIDEERAKMVRLIFQWRAYGLPGSSEPASVYAIAGQLLRMGFKPARKGKFFRANTVTNILRNEAYIGRYLRCGRLWAITDKDGKLLTIVESELFYRVQKMMPTVKRAKVGRPQADGNKHKALLWQYLWCGAKNERGKVCEGRMIGSSTTWKGELKRYYACRNFVQRRNPEVGPTCQVKRILVEPIDNAVFAAVWALLKDPARVRKLAVALAGEEAEKMAAKNQSDPREALKAARLEEGRVMRMIQRGDYQDEEQGSRELKKLRGRIAILENEARSVSKVIEVAPMDLIESVCLSIAGAKEPTRYETRRIVLEGLLDFKVVLNGKVATVSGAIPISTQAVPVAGGGKRIVQTGLPVRPILFEPIPFVINVGIAA